MMTDRQESGYTYDPKSKRFRGPDGRYVAASEVLSLRDQIIAGRTARTASLVNALYDGNISPSSFVLQMRNEIKSATLMEYMLGRGGINMLTQSDYGRMGSMLKVQYRYLNTFTRQIVDGEVTRDRAITRAALYIDTTRAAYERSRATAYNVDLPDYPGLHPNCACYWELVQDGDDVKAYWNTASANPCPDCEDRESRWNPFIVKGAAA